MARGWVWALTVALAARVAFILAQDNEGDDEPASPRKRDKASDDAEEQKLRLATSASDEFAGDVIREVSAPAGPGATSASTDRQGPKPVPDEIMKLLASVTSPPPQFPPPQPPEAPPQQAATTPSETRTQGSGSDPYEYVYHDRAALHVIDPPNTDAPRPDRATGDAVAGGHDDVRTPEPTASVPLTVPTTGEIPVSSFLSQRRAGAQPATPDDATSKPPALPLPSAEGAPEQAGNAAGSDSPAAARTAGSPATPPQPARTQDSHAGDNHDTSFAFSSSTAPLTDITPDKLPGRPQEEVTSPSSAGVAESSHASDRPVDIGRARTLDAAQVREAQGGATAEGAGTAESAAAAQEPKYTLKRGRKRGLDSMVLEVELPQASTVADVKLECSSRHVALDATRCGHGKLIVHLPKAVAHRQGRARFVPAMRLLKVTLPLQQQPHDAPKPEVPHV
ncbi:unnamed protein product [Pedinophyceae sp. YPF-701]|nr:unnamed protein product [Pedinophyceae sp. YPF-701]